MSLCEQGCCPALVVDLFSGAGGAAMGLHRAWPHARIVGVDTNPRLARHYPFEFVCADAMTYPLDGADFEWASPPCQEYSRMRFLRDSIAVTRGYTVVQRPKLVDAVRQRLIASGTPYCLENVPGAPMPDAIQLCGSMFGMPLRRHRWFSAGQLLWSVQPCQHTRGYYNVIGGKVRGYGDFASTTRTYVDCKGTTRRGEGYPGKKIGEAAMGIDWMSVPEMCEAIPPAYSEYIARQLTPALERAA